MDAQKHPFAFFLNQADMCLLLCRCVVDTRYVMQVGSMQWWQPGVQWSKQLSAQFHAGFPAAITLVKIL